MKKERSGFMSMAIGLVIISLAVSVSEYSYFNGVYPSGVTPASQTASPTNNQNSNPAEPQPPVLSDTFQNVKSGFSIQYPGDFVLQQKADGSASFNVPVKDYFKTVLVKDGDITLTVASPTKDCPSPKVIGGGATSSVLVGSPAGSFTKISGSDVGAGQLYDESLYTLSTNGMCYSIDFVLHSTNGAGFYYNDPAQIASTDAQEATDKTAFMKLIDRMVSTFTITK